MSMAARSFKSAGTRPDRAPPPIEPATLVALAEEGRVTVRVSTGDGHTRPLVARLAEIPGYRPTVGDRVLVARIADPDASPDEGPGEVRESAYVVAVIHAAAAPALVLGDGSRAELVEGALELRDGAGRLLVRYADGAAEVSAPSRDLKLSAPHGAVVIEAATDVSIDAARDLAQHAGRRVDVRAGDAGAAPQLRVEPAATRIKADRLHVEARSTCVATGEATLLARSLATTAESLAVNVERYELTATRVVEKARDVFRDVADLLQQRIGRARVMVDDSYALYTGRTVLESKEETSIDGKKILIG
jgi:Protein of unknown function (DUF3540)